MKVLTSIERDELTELQRRDEFFWLDLKHPTAEALDMLGSALGLHPLALEDTRDFGQRPKADPYGDHVFIVFYTPSRSGELEDPGVEVHIYVAGGFILTARRDSCIRMDALRAELAAEGPDASEEYLIHRILIALTDAHFPLVRTAQDHLERLEDEVFEKPSTDQLERIYRMRQSLGRYERRVSAQSEYFSGAEAAILALPGLTRGTEPYLRDVGDHLAKVTGELRRQRFDLASLTDTYFSANQNKLNRTATRLSVAATFFIVCTLITGFFGQNFRWLVDNVDTRSDFLVFGLGGLVVPILALSAYFWRRRDDWM